MISIFTLSYNEEIHIQFFIDHYRSRFPNCDITIYDNMSTDNTVEIAKSNNCIVIPYDTNNQINDLKYLEIKNNCWKNAQTDWVLVCDMDEILDIKPEDLNLNSIISFEGYNMINMEDNYDIYSMKYGVRAPPYDKLYLFNKQKISEINYQAGCHSANPIGEISYSSTKYKAYHYNFINIDLSLKKYSAYGKRLSSENLKYGWGKHYLFSEDQIKQEFYDLRKQAIKIRD